MSWHLLVTGSLFTTSRTFAVGALSPPYFRLGIPSSDTPVYRDFVSECRHRFRSDGVLHIPEFLPTDICRALTEEAESHFSDPSCVFRSTDSHTVYQAEVDGSYSRGHPRNALQRSSKSIVDYDRLDDETSPLRALYWSEDFFTFVRDVVSSGDDINPPAPLYRSACPYNAAYYNLYAEGDGLGWHFDSGEFGVNLVLGMPDEGGVFELHKGTRAPGDLWSFDTVWSILHRNNPETNDCVPEQATELTAVDNASPGSLILFAGAHNMHRVTPVVGPNPRINAIVHFEQSAGRRVGAYSLRKFFGREGTVRPEVAQRGRIC